MITTADLQPYQEAGVVAAARALHRSTRTINALAYSLGFEFKTHTEIELERRWQTRRQMVADVRRLARQRLPQREICEQLGITRWVLRHIADEYNIDINSRSYG